MKKNLRFLPCAVVPFLLLLLGPESVLGAEKKASLGLGFEYATGDYGTGVTTESYRIPLTVDFYPTDHLDLEVIIPFLYQSQGTTIMLGGKRFPAQEGMGDMGTGTGGGGHGMGGGTSSVEKGESRSGLGDVSLTAGYALMLETERSPLVRPLLYAKLPTADKDKGLGTGEFDYGGGLSLAKWFGSWSTYAEGLYVVPGSSAEFDPDNYWTFLISTGYRLTDRLRPGASLSGATAAFDGFPDSLEVKANLSYWTSDRVSLGGYLSKGISDGSPDFGAGVFAFVSF